MYYTMGTVLCYIVYTHFASGRYSPMKTSELFKHKKVLSFEIFPPKRTDAVDTVYETIEDLSALLPDFISVTYGAGGADNNKKTIEIASAIKNRYGIESVAHLTCVYHTRQTALDTVGALKSAGVKNILALRGDINPDYPPEKDFRYAKDLVKFIKEHGDFNIIGACYPEGHSESPSLKKDIEYLKEKVDAGVSQLTSQLFFDNDYFYSFRERAAAAGIDVPIEAGIMPVVNKNQIERMVELCGATVPRKFRAIMDRYGDKPEAMRDAGIAYAIDQIVDLITNGVDGIHLYTMNKPYIARKIHEAVGLLLET